LHSLSAIQSVITSSLKNSIDFKNKSLSLIGEELNFYMDTSILYEEEKTPYIAFHKFNSTFDENSNNDYILQFIVSLYYGEPKTDANGINYVEEVSFAEELALEALKDIKETLVCVGVDGDRSLYVSNYNILITEVGEAEDIQAIVTLRVSNENYL